MVIHCHQIPLCLQKYEPKMNDFDVQKLPKKLHFGKILQFKINFLLTGFSERQRKLVDTRGPFLVTSTGVNYQLFKLIIQR